MKMIALAAAAGTLLFALPAAEAATLSATFDPLSTSESYYAPVGGVNTGPGTYSPNVTGSVANERTSPFGDNTTHYDSVGADAVVTFGPGPTLSSSPVLTSAAFTEGPPSSSFGTGNDSFRFVWGSPDSYNKLTFFENGASVGSYQINASTPPDSISLGSGSYIATVSGMGAYDSVRFESLGQNAFEFAGVSAVPLPASLPMFGAAVLALGGIAVARRRSTKGVTAEA